MWGPRRHSVPQWGRRVKAVLGPETQSWVRAGNRRLQVGPGTARQGQLHLGVPA